MTADYRKIQKEVFSSEFNKFFRKKISLYLIKIEKLRKKYLFFACLAAAIAVIPVLFFLFYLFTDIESAIFFIKGRISLFVIAEACLIGVVSWIVKSYKNKVKPLILPRLLSFIGDFRLVEKDSLDYNIRNYVSSLGLFNEYNKFDCDDRIEGIYKNIKVSISEILLKKITGSGKRRNEITVFDGLLVKIPCPKKYQGVTYIRRNAINLGFNQNKVNLEDPEFEKYYDVYSSDQIEARYLITTSFMNRMVELAKKGIGQNITLSFEHGNVNIAVASSKDWFELPIMYSACNIAVYQSITLEIVTILSVIDSLRLDIKIGL